MARARRRSGIGPAALALPLAGCVALPAAPAGLAAPGPSFAPTAFFVGRTEGAGAIAVIARRAHAVHVVGIGRLSLDGTLILTQQVDEIGKPRRLRVWRIRQVSPGRFAGTLSDAAGPFGGDVTGNMLRLRFRMRGGLTAEQRLYLQPDGRTVLNRMTVRKLGVVVGVLSETIRRI